MATIVVGYDGSECAGVALKTALGVAGELGDQVHVVMSYEVSRLGGEVQDYAAALRERAEGILARATELAAQLDAQIETEIAEESPAHALAEVSKRLDARVIVVGTRGESPLKGALLGSTPHKLLQLSDRPVLVVPAPE
jgi:nucleotide-binding universal stress UspA family protein